MTVFPSGATEQNTWDPMGNPNYKIDRAGNMTLYRFDYQNRMIQRFPYFAPYNIAYFTYDAAGRMTQVNDNSGTYGFTYDDMNRLTQASTNYAFDSAGAFSVGYSYDAASNRATMTDPQSGVTTYTYDSLNRLTNIQDPQSHTFGFSYDSLSRRTQLTRPNGVDTNYTYDNLSRLLSVLHQNGSTTLDGASYTYDNAGNRVSKANYLNSVTENYTYDDIYQLTQVTHGTSTMESYTYDPVGNRLSSLGVSPYSYNSSNRLTSTPSASYTYDYNGNAASKTDSSGTTAFTWDYDQDQLTQVTLPSSATVTFKYDPFGRRVQRSSTGGTVNYLFDGPDLIEELDNGGNVLAHFANTSKIDEPLSVYSTGSTNYYEQDGINAVTSITNSSGAVTSTYIYDSFGNLNSSSGSTVNYFRYTGREFDPDTGLYFYRARYYDSNTGRFISEDPIMFGGGINFYSYALNTPVNLRDPSGKNAAALPIAEAFGAVACFGSGVCETIVIVGGTVIAIGATGYLIHHWYESRSRGKSDPIPYPGERRPGQCNKEPGKCNPCPPPSPFWDQPGNAHGGTMGFHYHWYVFNQKPYPDCTCYPARMSDGAPPSGGTPWTPGGSPWP